MTTAQMLITIGAAVLATVLTRALPFLVFPEGRPAPRYVRYLGNALPPAVFGLLVVYCLRSVDVMGATHGLPEALAILGTAALHLWKRNMPLSIFGGTALYMAILALI